MVLENSWMRMKEDTGIGYWYWFSRIESGYVYYLCSPVSNIDVGSGLKI
jgi:hypothetical protein